jgi:hypothetical protein
MRVPDRHANDHIQSKTAFISPMDRDRRRIILPTFEKQVMMGYLDKF